jgi:flagellar hook-length control protein FliK
LGSPVRGAPAAVTIEVADPAAPGQAQIPVQVPVQLPQTVPASSGSDRVSIATSDADIRQQTIAESGIAAEHFRAPLEKTNVSDLQTATGMWAPAEGDAAQSEAPSRGLEFNSLAASGSGATDYNPSPDAIESLAREGYTIPPGAHDARQSEPATPEVAKVPSPGVGARSGVSAIDSAEMSDRTASTGSNAPGIGDAVPPITEAAARSAHRQSAAESQSPPAQTTAHGTGADASAWTRIPLGTHASFSDVAGSAALPASGATGASRETFAALDAGTAMGAPAWIHAGGQKAEAGFQDPTLGWVGVRADLSGGGIHATLMPGSAEAAQALSSHLPGLNAYLQDQHAPTAAVTVASQSGGLEAGVGQNMQQGAGQNTEPNTVMEPQPSPHSGLDPVSGARTPASAAESRQLEPTASAGDPRGLHISVMA